MEREKSCGCIIIDDGKVLLIRQTLGHWGLPKGHVEEGESEAQTATREVKEETNIDVEIDETKRYVETYELPSGNVKDVIYFVAHPISKELKMQEEEVTNAKWLTFDEAVEAITYDNTRELLKKALAEL